MEKKADFNRISLLEYPQPITLGSEVYRIEKFLGEGSTCLSYEAWRQDSAGAEHRVILKEFFPSRYPIRRQEDGRLKIPAKLWESEVWQRFSRSYEQYKKLFAEEKINLHIVQAHRLIGKPRIQKVTVADKVKTMVTGTVNGTVYLEVDYSSGISMADYIASKPRLPEFLEIMDCLADTLERLHDLGYICTDLKPENLLCFEEKLVRILDSDAILPKKKITRLPSSKGFGAPEVLGYHGTLLEKRWFAAYGQQADVYSFGAIVYFYLFGTTEGTEKDFADALGERLAGCSGKAVRLIRELLQNTLAKYSKDRMENMNQVRDALKQILPLVDAETPRIQENFRPDSRKVFGRETQLQTLRELLENQNAPGRVAAICGMGGVGKSTLARLYGETFAESYDVIAEVTAASFRDAVKCIVIENWQPDTSHWSRSSDEQTEDMLRQLCREHSALIIVHDYNVSADPDFGKWKTLGADVILTSRHDWQGELPALRLKCEDLHPDDAAAIFREFYLQEGQREACLEADRAALDRLLRSVNHHPLTIKLLARYLAARELTPAQGWEALEISFAPDSYVLVRSHKDAAVTENNIYGHLAAIFRKALQENLFSDQALDALRYMTLISSQHGISLSRFVQWTRLDSFFLKQLQQYGWVEYYPGRQDLLDPEPQPGIYTMPMIIQEVLGKEASLACTTENIRPFLEKLTAFAEEVCQTDVARLLFCQQQALALCLLPQEDSLEYAQLLLSSARNDLEFAAFSGSISTAAAKLEAALEIFQQEPACYQKMFKCHAVLAECHSIRNDYQKAWEHISKGLSLYKKHALPEDHSFFTLLNCQFLYQWQRGKMQETIQAIQSLLLSNCPIPREELVNIVTNWGHYLQFGGYWQEAQDALADTRKRCSKQLEQKRVYRFAKAHCLSSKELGLLYLKTGKLRSAADLMQEALRAQIQYVEDYQHIGELYWLWASIFVKGGEHYEDQPEKTGYFEGAAQFHTFAVNFYEQEQETTPLFLCMLELSLDYRQLPGQEAKAGHWQAKALEGLRTLPEGSDIHSVEDVFSFLSARAETFLQNRRVPDGLQALEYRADLFRRVFGRGPALGEEYRSLAEQFAAWNLPRKQEYYLKKEQLCEA
ncbi:MAG: hypothetical protein J6J12_03930 [Oscillospiraceae bacterium]|nr:hypothetical protein [Oscillospiraceae bacterium]